MGDEDRDGSLEAEQVEEDEMKVLLHCPSIYSLPEEIKKMDRSETVCRYCGVSYLIFHEFHQLHTKLTQMETDLQQLRETAQREKALREALEQGRHDWERTLRREVLKQAEVRERSAREEMEERNQDMARSLREELQAKIESARREVEEEFHKISCEKERQLREELEEEAEKVRRQRDELEIRAEEREKVLSAALQKSNKNSSELRNNLQQLEERLTIAAAMNKEAEQTLAREKQQSEVLRVVCMKQKQTLQATISLLHSSGSSFTDIRGFLSQLKEAWQAFSSQIVQHTEHLFSVLSEELQHCNVESQKRQDRNECLLHQLMEQKRLREEQLSQQENSEKEHTENLLRLKVELEQKHKQWLSCQQRCNSVREQLLSQEQREQQMEQKYCAAVEEVTQGRKVLERSQQETTKLRRERDLLIEFHEKAVTKMKEDFSQQLATKLSAALGEQRSQSALYLQEQMEEFRKEVELELSIDMEKNQLLLQQYQQDNSQLQQKLKEKNLQLQNLQEEFLQEKSSMEEQRRARDEIHQQKALQLSQAKTEVNLLTEENTELHEEVALLQEAVRRECEEREELTAALSQAQQELCELRSRASHQGAPGPPPDSIQDLTARGQKNFHLQSQPRVPLTRSPASPNTLRHSPSSADKDRGRGTDGGEAERNVESRKSVVGLGEDKRREGTLPRLKASSTVGEVKHKVSIVTTRKDKV